MKKKIDIFAAEYAIRDSLPKDILTLADLFIEMAEFEESLL